MLEWSRAQSGRIDYSPEYFDLAEIVDESLKMLKFNAEDKDIGLISGISHGVMVFADKNMVKFIIRNLTSNGIKFTRNGGRVTFSSRIVDGKAVEICISDTGTGMTQEQIRKLFRIDELNTMPGTKGEQGTGLGLVVCKEFLTINKGSIHVESFPGRGSRFYFRLPTTNIG
jgi:signal transduction histidine kinase